LVGCIDSGRSTIAKTLALKYGLTYVNVENAILRWEKENSNGELFQNV
jgi:shikimate kinase